MSCDTQSPAFWPAAATASTLRGHLGSILESNAWHWTIIVLSTIEFGLSFAEILYDYLDASNLCRCTNSCQASPVFEALDWASLFITTLFLFEIPLDLFTFGANYYLPRGTRHWFLHSFDTFVVIGAFVISIQSQNTSLESVVSLLIILRLWRILKIVLSIEIGTRELQEAQQGRTRGGLTGGEDEKQKQIRYSEEDANGSNWKKTGEVESEEEEVEGLKEEIKRLKERIRRLESRA